MDDLFAALSALDHDLGLIAGPADTGRFATDATRRPEVAPPLVIRPRDTAGTAAALACCHALGARVVVQGGLTGLSGGARVATGEVALTTERMTALHPVDRDAAQIRSGAGVPLQRLQEAAEAADLMVGVDLGARGSATLGGLIATNAGGVRVLRYGMMRAQVAGLTAVLADGTVVEAMRGLEKDNAGFDLRHLFIGSEGTLGVVTEALLRLHPRPGLTRTALCAVPDAAAALTLLRRLRSGLGGLLSAFEGIWPEVYAGAASIAGQNPLPHGHGLYLLVEMKAPLGLVQPEAFDALLMQAIEAGEVADAVIALNGRDEAALWRLREACPEYTFSLGRLVAHDLSVPLAALPEFLRRAAEALRAADPAAQALVYGHLGDGNLHYVVKTLERDRVLAAINGLAAAMGGSITAEHGVGQDKARYLALVRSPAERGLMAALKATLDPAGTLNPGRVLQG